MTPPDEAHLRTWIGRTERQQDLLDAARMRGYWATLDREGEAPGEGEELPPLAAWMYGVTATRQDRLGPDGHAARGEFLPPVDLPRRMWAGGRLRFHHPLHVGEQVERRSRIDDVRVRQGRSGTLVFVTVRHEIRGPRGLALTELQDIVYREAPRAGAPAAPAPAPGGAEFEQRIDPGPVLLFRYSALTFNSHRIHYDRKFVTEQEGYPGLLVHGPLIATLLLELLQRQLPGQRVREFAFRALGPLFDVHPFSVCGRAAGPGAYALWARDPAGGLAMQAEAVVEPAAVRA